MKKTLILFIAFVSLLIVSSCNMPASNSNKSVGISGEVLIFCDDLYWVGLLDTFMYETIGSTVKELDFNPEPLFDLKQLPPSMYDKSLKKHKNIIIIDIEPGCTPIIEGKKDINIHPQYLVKIKAPNTTEAKRLINENANQIKKEFENNEIIRLLEAYKYEKNTAISNVLIKNHQFDLTVPENWIIATDSSNFVWLRMESDKSSYGIMVYYQDYTDTICFENDYINEYRNKITEKYIRHENSDNAYMIIQDAYEPKSELFDFHGKYSIRTHGYWKISQDAFMGGPYKSYTLVDKSSNPQRVVTIDGYLFSPDESNRDRLWMLEAIMQSLEFTNEEE